MFIGIAGKARSGKDTAADILKELTNQATYSFANPLKKRVNLIFGWDERHGWGSLKEEKLYTRVVHKSEVNMLLNNFLFAFVEEEKQLKMHFDFYEVFQDFVSFDNLGFMQWNISPRKAYQLFGTEFARKRIKDSIWLDMAPTQGVIIPDVRFDNEAAFIKENAGFIIKIERDHTKINESSHSSEAGISEEFIDFIVDNNGTMKQLEKQIKDLHKVVNSGKYSKSK